MEDNIFDYEGENNVIVLPITRFIRKDGNLVVISDVARLFFEKYTNLSKKWGYMISQEIPYPSYATKSTNLVGIPNKGHYASAINNEMFENGLWYIREESLLKPDLVFYIVEESFMSIKKIKEVFSDSENLVFLRKKD